MKKIKYIVDCSQEQDDGTSKTVIFTFSGEPATHFPKAS